MWTKAEKKLLGYYPDYGLWLEGLPTVIIEAKSPNEDAREGLQDTRLYALELNRRYPHKINPVTRVLCINGLSACYGFWDADETFELALKAAEVGTRPVEHFRSFFDRSALTSFALECRKKISIPSIYRTRNYIGGQKIIDQSLGPNEFSGEVAPLIAMYLTDNPLREEEIIQKGYVIAETVAHYGNTLDVFLRDRVQHVAGERVTPITVHKSHGADLTSGLSEYARHQALPGQTQLIIGSVGAGKTTFLKRYFGYYIPGDLKKQFAFVRIDFNSAPDKLEDIEGWICSSFVESMNELEYDGNLYSHDNLRRFFSQEINQRNKGVYAEIFTSNRRLYVEKITEDLRQWTDDKVKLTLCICRHLIGEARRPVVVAFDNVDRRDSSQQLRIFQSVNWFKENTRSFCIICLRDTTFENHKGDPPLDAFSRAPIFYIQAPLFTHVVKRRLDLMIEYLIEEAGNSHSYDLPNGVRVTYPTTRIGIFLTKIYMNLFLETRPIAMVLDGLSGRDVREALNMFADLLNTKHIPETVLTQTVIAEGNYSIPEFTVLRGLMRTSYRMFANDHGYMTNIFELPEGLTYPSPFMLVEILAFLIQHRKKQGDSGAEGFYTVKTVATEMERLGYYSSDTRIAVEHLRNHHLLISDFQSKDQLEVDDLVRIHSSGFIHVRFLTKRLEYLAGILPTVTYFEESIAKEVGHTWVAHLDSPDISRGNKIRTVELFLSYLERMYKLRTERNPFFAHANWGAKYVIQNIQKTLAWANDPQARFPYQRDLFE